MVSSTDPFINVPDYPEVDRICDAIATLPKHSLVAADRLARQAGSGRAQNMVLLGAATPYLGIQEELLERGIREAFAAKGEKIQKTNIDAFRAGKAAGQAYRDCLKAGMTSKQARVLVGRCLGGVLAPEAVPVWKDLFSKPIGSAVVDTLASSALGKLTGTVEVARNVAASASSADQLPSLLFKA